MVLVEIGFVIDGKSLSDPFLGFLKMTLSKVNTTKMDKDII